MFTKLVRPFNKEGNPHGLWEFHFKDGNIKKYNVDDGIIIGLHTTQNSTGDIILKKNWVNNLLEGEEIEYYD